MSVSDDVSMDYYQKKLMAESWCSQISAGAVASVEDPSCFFLWSEPHSGAPLSTGSMEPPTQVPEILGVFQDQTAGNI